MKGYVRRRGTLGNCVRTSELIRRRIETKYLTRTFRGGKCKVDDALARFGYRGVRRWTWRAGHHSE